MIDQDDDLRTAKCLRSYADKYAVLHRDISDDFIRGAEALEQRASRLSNDAVLVEALRNMVALIEASMMPLSKDEYREVVAARNLIASRPNQATKGDGL